MSEKNAKRAVTCVGLGFLLSAVLFVASAATGGVLDATWTAPTTNTDGSRLTDLASYRVFYGVSGSPCPGSASVQIASPTSTPSSGQTVSVRLTGLTTGARYNAAVVAVDASGNQSACSSIASGVARIDFAVSPSGTINYGTVNIGSFA
jgi:hypothetical protein